MLIKFQNQFHRTKLNCYQKIYVYIIIYPELNMALFVRLTPVQLKLILVKPFISLSSRLTVSARVSPSSTPACYYMWLCMTLYDPLWWWRCSKLCYDPIQRFSIMYDYVCLCKTLLATVQLFFLPSSASTSTPTSILAEVSLILGFIFPPTPTPNRKSIFTPLRYQ